MGGQKIKNRLNILGSCFIFLFVIGCASKDEVVSKAHPATYVNEIFEVDNGMPLREVQKKKFYYKKCELESRRPFESKIEYSCEEK